MSILWHVLMVGVLGFLAVASIALAVGTAYGALDTSHLTRRQRQWVVVHNLLWIGLSVAGIVWVFTFNHTLGDSLLIILGLCAFLEFTQPSSEQSRYFRNYRSVRIVTFVAGILCTITGMAYLAL
jgi:hypothetical protein